MARPIKRGIDYFNIDCSLDDKVEYVEAKHGLIGYAILVKLWAKIYKFEGYYCEWKEKNIYLFCKDISTEVTQVNEVVNTCFEEGLFCRQIFELHGVLTSKGIQKRWLQIVTQAKRKEVKIEPKYNLLELTQEETELTQEETNETQEESTQSKVKKRKGEESKEVFNPHTQFANASSGKSYEEIKAEQEAEEAAKHKGKTRYLDCVWLTQKDYEALHIKEGKQVAEWMIERLNYYKQSKPDYNSPSDYAYMQGWIKTEAHKHFLNNQNATPVRTGLNIKKGIAAQNARQ